MFKFLSTMRLQSNKVPCTLNTTNFFSHAIGALPIPLLALLLILLGASSAYSSTASSSMPVFVVFLYFFGDRVGIALPISNISNMESNGK